MRLVGTVLSFIAAFLCTGHAFATNKAARIEVDASELRMTVWSEDEQLLHEYSNISIGSGGLSPIHYRGDESTPMGEFRVSSINPNSRFGIFIGLDYPTLDHAEAAFREQRLPVEDYRRILDALYSGQHPPANTVLGGHIGIHGIGGGSRHIHEHINWTDGCVALTNEEVEALHQLVQIGTRVVIRP